MSRIRTLRLAEKKRKNLNGSCDKSIETILLEVFNSEEIRINSRINHDEKKNQMKFSFNCTL